MFSRKKQIEECSGTVKAGKTPCNIIPTKAIFFTLEQIHAWNCVVYSAEDKHFTNKVFKKHNLWEEVMLTEIDFALWMLESKNVSGISADMACDLIDKLKLAFISFYK